MIAFSQKFARSICLAASLALSACAASSGIVPIGPDTYTVSELRAPAAGGGPEAARVVMAESTAFCQRQNRMVLPLALRPDGDPFTPYYPTAYDATFRCLPPADAATTRMQAGHP